MDRIHQVLFDGLTRERDHVRGTLAGLSDEQLRQSVLPSGWTCLGLVKHLALAVEHYWFRCIMAGESLTFLDEVGDEWQVGEDETAASVLALYAEEIERSNAVIGAMVLTDPPRQRDPRWEEWQLDFPDLIRIMTHAMIETACHAGHLDTVREMFDGHQWSI